MTVLYFQAAAEVVAAQKERELIASARVWPNFAREKRFIDASRDVVSSPSSRSPGLLAMTRPLHCSDGHSKLAYCAEAYALSQLVCAFDSARSHLRPPPPRRL